MPKDNWLIVAIPVRLYQFVLKHRPITQLQQFTYDYNNTLQSATENRIFLNTVTCSSVTPAVFV